MVALGTALIPYMTTTGGLIFAIGVLSAGGAGMAGPSVLMAATTRLVPANKRGIATGIVNAGGSFGQFIFAPIAQGVMALAGWAVALQTLAALTLLALPAAWVLRARPVPAAAPASAAVPAPPASPGAGGGSTAAPVATPVAARLSTGQAVRQAIGDPSFRLLATGFFVCGFHVAFLATHLPGVVASCMLPAAVGAWSLAMVGLFNIVGSFGIGWAIGYRGGQWRMKSLLSLIYATRALAVLIFVFAPKSTAVMLVFAAVMGLTFLSTVPPTVGLVAKFFGPAHIGTLFGLVMVTHQIGGFLGAWLGGKAFEANGNYDWMWYADCVLAIGAALIHLPIREAKRGMTPAAA
jgi:predicted MFS family arabinose efflux permease